MQLFCNKFGSWTSNTVSVANFLSEIFLSHGIFLPWRITACVLVIALWTYLASSLVLFLVLKLMLYLAIWLLLQVAEVVSSTKTRLSVNGWFHGPPAPRPSPYKEPLLPMHPPLPLDVSVYTLILVADDVIDNSKFRSLWSWQEWETFAWHVMSARYTQSHVLYMCNWPNFDIHMTVCMFCLLVIS